MIAGRRKFLGSAAALGALAGAGALQSLWAAEQHWDLVIVGAGTAGLPAAIFASRRGARVLLIDAADEVGGTLHLANGQVSGAGTSLQRALGIQDSPQRHYDDIMRVSGHSADPRIVRLAVDNAAATIDWLLAAGLEPLPGHPVTGESPGRPMYSVRRYLWGRNEGRDILAAINRELAPELASGRIVTQLATRATELLTDERGAVEGVRGRCDGRDLVFRGRHVLLTSGGYASNPAMFRRLCGFPNYAGSSYPQSQGDGLELATSVGGYLRGREKYRSGFGSILASEQYPAKITGRFVTVPQTRPPWEIWVNARGERFVREDEPLQAARERALLHEPELRYWIVFDDRIFQAAPPGITGWSRERMRAAFDSHPMFTRAASVDALARACGIDAAGLERTVAQYNAGIAGAPDALGREHRPLPLAQPPYFAIRHQGHSATSVVGVTVDGQLRVLRGDGSVVRGLYAAGEVLGSGATMGNSFAAGMMLTPALSLGRHLGRTLPLSTS
jgi:fumarate reductase flavoprotein subunit